jgi:1-acyl-sn-glycerol-3-phosphate acyltransferase
MRSLAILGTTFTFNNFKTLPKNVPLSIISNHQSMWDIPPLMWKFRKHRPKFIAKKELSRFIPSISYNLRYGGSIGIDRSQPKEAIEQIKSFAKNIRKNNFSVCIFPEGTRNPNGKVGPFKFSGIEAMVNEMPNALLVPVAIRNTGKIDNTKSFFRRLGVRVSYTLLETRKISTNSVEEELEDIREKIIEIAEQ